MVLFIRIGLFFNRSRFTKFKYLSDESILICLGNILFIYSVNELRTLSDGRHNKSFKLSIFFQYLFTLLDKFNLLALLLFNSKKNGKVKATACP